MRLLNHVPFLSLVAFGFPLTVVCAVWDNDGNEAALQLRNEHLVVRTESPSLSSALKTPADDESNGSLSQALEKRTTRYTLSSEPGPSGQADQSQSQSSPGQVSIIGSEGRSSPTSRTDWYQILVDSGARNPTANGYKYVVSFSAEPRPSRFRSFFLRRSRGGSGGGNPPSPPYTPQHAVLMGPVIRSMDGQMDWRVRVIYLSPATDGCHVFTKDLPPTPFQGKYEYMGTRISIRDMSFLTKSACDEATRSSSVARRVPERPRRFQRPRSSELRLPPPRGSGSGIGSGTGAAAQVFRDELLRSMGFSISRAGSSLSLPSHNSHINTLPLR